jgi:WD40 repeat protein
MSYLGRIALALALALALDAGSLCAQDQPDLPPQAPFLRIDAEMHTAPIRRLGVDASCSLLATASDDKTVRLWRLPDGQLVNTLRPPIGDGNEGKVYAVAVAPDTRWIAAGGFTRTGGDHWVYIFKAATGAMVARFGPYPRVVANLAVSADGRRLAATFWRGDGVRVWERQGRDIADWRLIAEDSNYHGRDANGAAFALTGELFTVADDGSLRRYDLDRGQFPKIAPTRGGRRPYSVSIARDDNRVAVGFADRAAVDIYDPTTLSWSFTAQQPGEAESGGLSAVTWTAKGDRLFAGGTVARGGDYLIRAWDEGGKGSPREIAGSSDAIMNMLACGEGVVVAAGTPAFGLLRADGSRQFWRGPIGADMRDKLGQNFLISSDARRVRFGLGQGGADPVLFDLDAQHLIASPERPQGLFAAETSELAIEDWRNSPRLRLGGEPIRLDVNERSQSLAIARDKQQFVVGSDFFLRAFDKDGVILWPPKQAPGVFWGVNLSQDGRLAVAAAGDGTIRWYRMTDGRELLALFIERAQREWIAWTPKGYYMASPGGGNLIGWHVNRHWDESADFFALSHFRGTYDRPDIVSRILAELDEDKAIDGANAFLEKRRANEDVKKTLPPVVAIVPPAGRPLDALQNAVEVGLDVREVTVRFSVRSPTGHPISRVYAMLDDRPAPGAMVVGPALDAKGDATGELKVKITPYSTTVLVIAESDTLSSAPAMLTLHRPIVDGPPAIKPTLYALVVGIGDYRNVTKLGDVPANDADAVAAELAAQGADGTFAKVELKPLKDAAATLPNLLDGLQWLSDKAQDSQSDIALLYFSGHGAIVKSDALLLPVDYDPQRPIVTGLSKEKILAALRGITGRVVFIVDACHAAAGFTGANMLNTSGLVGEFADASNGITAFASSVGTEVSRAAPGASNSYYTEAFVEGLRGRARPPSGNLITTVSMDNWLTDQVPRLTNHMQTPVMRRPLVGYPPPLATAP